MCVCRYVYVCMYGVYIYIIYNLKLGFEIAVFVWEREQGRFRESSE